jgi:hypothetical protein
LTEPVTTTDIDIELDNSLFGDRMEIDFEDGYVWGGFWIEGHLICWAAATIKTTHPDVPNVVIKRVRCGSTAHRILLGTSLNKDLENDQPTA